MNEGQTIDFFAKMAEDLKPEEKSVKAPAPKKVPDTKTDAKETVETDRKVTDVAEKKAELPEKLKPVLEKLRPIMENLKKPTQSGVAGGIGLGAISAALAGISQANDPKKKKGVRKYVAPTLAGLLGAGAGYAGGNFLESLPTAKPNDTGGTNKVSPYAGLKWWQSKSKPVFDVSEDTQKAIGEMKDSVLDWLQHDTRPRDILASFLGYKGIKNLGRALHATDLSNEIAGLTKRIDSLKDESLRTFDRFSRSTSSIYGQLLARLRGEVATRTRAYNDFIEKLKADYGLRGASSTAVGEFAAGGGKGATPETIRLGARNSLGGQEVISKFDAAAKARTKFLTEVQQSLGLTNTDGDPMTPEQVVRELKALAGRKGSSAYEKQLAREFDVLNTDYTKAQSELINFGKTELGRLPGRQSELLRAIDDAQRKLKLHEEKSTFDTWRQKNPDAPDAKQIKAIEDEISRLEGRRGILGGEKAELDKLHTVKGRPLGRAISPKVLKNLAGLWGKNGRHPGSVRGPAQLTAALAYLLLRNKLEVGE